MPRGWATRWAPTGEHGRDALNGTSPRRYIPWTGVVIYGVALRRTVWLGVDGLDCDGLGSREELQRTVTSEAWPGKPLGLIGGVIEPGAPTPSLLRPAARGACTKLPMAAGNCWLPHMTGFGTIKFTAGGTIPNGFGGTLASIGGVIGAEIS